jgi:hypothetical protein
MIAVRRPGVVGGVSLLQPRYPKVIYLIEGQGPSGAGLGDSVEMQRVGAADAFKDQRREEEQ